MKHLGKTVEELGKMGKKELTDLIIKMFPIAYHTVDMAIVRTGQDGMPEVLLIRKKNDRDEKTLFAEYTKLKNSETSPETATQEAETLADMLANFWRFPGGFVDPTDNSTEAAAMREAYEETHMECEVPPAYIGSSKINDGRYSDTPHRIITSFFELKYKSGEAGQGFDDVVESRWFSIPELDKLELKHPIHAKLFEMLEQRYRFHKYAHDFMNEASEFITDASKRTTEELDKFKAEFGKKMDKLSDEVEKMVPELKSKGHEIFGKISATSKSMFAKMREFVE